ncbi:MAG: trypsin-like peptidase domain-containing protein [Clostridiales bacterium]|jgi:serine protease Do|nr:trypsin-like peptidase domain-containing protein [Clostridiales bacterium]
MNKRTLAVFMAVTVAFSAAAGFGGATAANYFQKPAQPLLTAAETLNSGEVPALGGASVLPLSAASSGASRTAMSIPQISEKVADTVVEIVTERVVTSNFFRQYRTSGAGSGVIISSDGLIITCNHVIEGANKVTVVLKNGTEYEANLVGRDVRTDLAIIKIQAEGLNAAAFADSSNINVGELAVAIGNPLGELGGTVTEGIISALNRDIDIDGEMMNLMQTSAAVNPGNSGGGLFNAYGELIGVVNAKHGGSNVEGIGFAIPSNVAREVANQLSEFGYVVGRVELGISLVDINDMFTAMRYGLSSLGVYAAESDEDSGLEPGDLIVSIDGVPVGTTADVKSIIEKYNVGDALTVIISRGGSDYKTTVTLKQSRD